MTIKHSFKNDYSEGAHPDVLAALVKNNDQQQDGYGLDSHSVKVAKRIQELTADGGAAVHLLSGGTQTNLLAISSFLRPHEACITAKTGHIATHETGAIEATGHKLLTAETTDGKLTPSHIKPLLEEHHFEHMVKPAMVYISNPTELGTVYSKDELATLAQFCKDHSLLLYIDGARLGSAIVCQEAQLSLADIHQFSDAFFIGGTKNGALLGEALVVRNTVLQRDLRYLIKQRGALLAKGRVLGIQFEELFKENLYFDIARSANQKAQSMAMELKKLGCDFLVDSPTNQIFPIMENPVITELQKNFDFYLWAPVDQNRSAARLVTSWATSDESVDRFVDAAKQIIRPQ